EWPSGQRALRASSLDARKRGSYRRGKRPRFVRETDCASTLRSYCSRHEARRDKTMTALPRAAPIQRVLRRARRRFDLLIELLFEPVLAAPSLVVVLLGPTTRPRLKR